ncbi:MAG: hypothetical protein ACYC35_24265 [Pirellulales bacterium]
MKGTTWNPASAWPWKWDKAQLILAKTQGGLGGGMGGRGSGNWYRWHGKKATVEESVSLAVRDFRKHLYHNSDGSFTWTWSGGHQASVGYSVDWDAGAPTITVHYRWRDQEDIRIPIRLQTTPTQFGGERWWFTCPLTVNGVPCNRRAGNLYLPPGSRYFGCRKCHGLTYGSSQEAHQGERLGFWRH